MIIGLSGYAGVGKDTLAMHIKKKDSSFVIKKFSGKLKVIASILTGIPEGMFESQSFKSLELNGWNMTVREFLQRLGTEAIRDGLHNDSWVNALFCDYHQGDNWVITDMRFPNEFEAVKKFGGMAVRLWRPDVHPVNYHESEVALDKYAFDYIASNDGGEDKWEDVAGKILDVVKNK
jgi:hypothetical protein